MSTAAYEMAQMLCRNDLKYFLRKGFGILEPGSEYEYNWHIECITEHLTACYTGEIKRLIINIPPRSLKSFSVAQCFPAWVMGKSPGQKFIMASYAYSLAEDNVRKCRSIMRDEWYRDTFPQTVISADQDQKHHFETTKGGIYYGAGIGGTIIGKGCFVAGTLIHTKNGDIPIEKLNPNDCNQPLILSYSHEDKSLKYCKITDWCEKTTNNIIEIRTHSGRAIRCTPDHPLYVAGEYRRADSLSVGEKLYNPVSASVQFLQNGFHNSNARDAEEIPMERQGCVLRHSMLKVASCREESQEMREMWKRYSKKNRCKILLKGLQTKLQQTVSQALCYLQEAVQTAFGAEAILFRALRKSRSFTADAWNLQPEISGWHVIQRRFPQNAPKDIGARRRCLCDMRNCSCSNKKQAKNSQQTLQSGDSSHRPRSTQQHCRESYNPMRHMPRYAPQIQGDTISSIECISDREVKIYDITVDDCHNFFADGILAHNCDYIVLDDPLNPKEAMSDTIRASTISEIRSTLFSRFNDKRTGRFILIMQRLHESDPTGDLLRDGGYVHLKLPAIAYKPVHVSLGDKSWAMTEGQLLFPKRLTAAILEQTRKDMTELHFSGQMLQDPVPVGGGEFREDWMQWYTEGSIKPNEMNIVILVDAAGGDELNKKKKKTSDWTVMAVVGLAPDNNRYLLDMIRDRLNPTERIETLFMLHRKWNALAKKSPKVGYEKYGMMSDTHYIKEKHKQDAYHFAIVELGGKVMKEERIRQIIPDMQNGRWFFPATLPYIDQEGRKFDLITELKGEMASFPRARYDDILDAIARVYEPDLYMTFPLPRATMTQKASRQRAMAGGNEDWGDW